MIQKLILMLSIVASISSVSYGAGLGCVSYVEQRSAKYLKLNEGDIYLVEPSLAHNEIEIRTFHMLGKATGEVLGVAVVQQVFGADTCLVLSLSGTE